METLASSITVTVDGTPREIFMSFALLNRITYLTGKPEKCSSVIQNNPELQEAVLRELLAERDNKGKPIHPEMKEIDQYEISLSDVQDLLNFASEHVMDFSLAAVEKSTRLQGETSGSSQQIKLDSYSKWSQQQDFIELCSLVFNTYPSHLERELFWQVSHNDIKVKMKLHLGEKQALIVQEFQTLAQVVKLAFGDNKNEKVEKPQSAAELKKCFAKQFYK